MEKIFKAKRLDTGYWYVFNMLDIEWSDDDSFRVKVFLKLPNGSKSESFVFVSKDTICQYTGINDKEGNRIFEGDELLDNESIEGCKYFVSFCDKSYCVKIGDEPAFDWFLDFGLNNQFKLTGHNIHDRG